MNAPGLVADAATLALGVAIIGVLAGAWWSALRAHDARKRDAVGARVAAALPPRRRMHRARIAMFTLGAVAAWIVATAPPRRFEPADADTAFADVVIVLDVSRSMLAQDLAPSRLERARTLVHRLVDARDDARFALVTFAGDAQTSIPLTHDRATFHELLDDVGTDLPRRGGTDFATALEAAAGAFGPTRAAKTPRTILLFSDGEDLAGRGADAARWCAEGGVTVSCVGLGTALGAKIPVVEHGPAGTARFVRDGSGDDVVTRFDRSGLVALAKAGGGRFVDGNDPLDAVVDVLRTGAMPSARVATADGGEGASALLALTLLAAVAWWIEAAWAERSPR